MRSSSASSPRTERSTSFHARRATLAASIEVNELIEDDLDAIGFDAEGLGRAEDPLHVAVVVGSPDIHDPVEAAPHLVEQIGTVLREVRGLAAGPDQGAILVVAE